MGVYYGGGAWPDNAAPGNAAGARCGGREGEGGEAGEQQIRAPGNPYSSFSSSSSSLCIWRGFDKKFCFRQRRTVGEKMLYRAKTFCYDIFPKNFDYL